jgi:predicted RNase H-like nuclease (RuvC/YqgF family)
MTITKTRLIEINEQLQSELFYLRRENARLQEQNRRLIEHLESALALIAPYQRLADYVKSLRERVSSESEQYQVLSEYIVSFHAWAKRRAGPKGVRT